MGAISYEGDVWDFYSGKAQPHESLPVGVDLTIAAAKAGSKSSVITNEDGWYKRGLNVDIIRPKLCNYESCPYIHCRLTRLHPARCDIHGSRHGELFY